MIEISILEDLGLTPSEIKVYLALLKLGESKKDPIVREARISASKLYDVTGKLIEKGLVTVIIKNGVKHFKASPPETLLEVIHNKTIALKKNEDSLKKIMSDLHELSTERIKKEVAEMYVGWKGLENLYGIILNDLKRGQEDYVIGATQGVNIEKTELFYSRINKKMKSKGIKLNILFGNSQRDYAKMVSKKGGLKYNKVRFLDFDFPSEINIFNNNVAIIVHANEPIGLRINNQVLAKNFIALFNSLWKQAKA